jgi:hypothetical protein
VDADTPTTLFPYMCGVCTVRTAVGTLPMAVVSLLVVSYIAQLDGVGYELNGISYASFAIADRSVVEAISLLVVSGMVGIVGGPHRHVIQIRSWRIEAVPRGLGERCIQHPPWAEGSRG